MSQAVRTDSKQRHDVIITMPPEREEQTEVSRGSCPKPRDWSEWVILPAAIFSFSAGMVGAVSESVDPENNGEFFTVSCFVISGVLGLSWVRVRQLWVKKSLDQETREFEGENRGLTKRVGELEGLLSQKAELIDKLQGDVERFQKEDAELANQSDRLAKETSALKSAIQMVPEHRRELVEESAELAGRVDEIQRKAGDEQKQSKAAGSSLDTIEMTLASLQRQSQLEKERHQQAMEDPDRLKK